ncbi:DUF983 domain-containing protein [Pinibacter soli]
MKTIIATTDMMNEKPSASLPAFAKCKCPRCRQGDMFVNKNPYQLKETMKMNETCPVCGQPFNLEVGFYYGSSYISYAFTVALSVATFVAWWVLIGFSLADGDHRLFYWIGINAVVLIVLQPYLMRLARRGWLSFFARYDKDWRLHPAERPERLNSAQEENW